jgi:hypothetical protein
MQHIRGLFLPEETETYLLLWTLLGSWRRLPGLPNIPETTNFTIRLARSEIGAKPKLMTVHGTKDLGFHVSGP